MKKLALLTVVLIASAAYAGDTLGADIERLQTSSTILEQIMTAPDRGIPDKIMEGAKCIAVIPSMLKASFIFGANYGKGVATCRTGKGWSAPVFFRVTGGSWGLQAGGQASDLVLIIRTEDGMQYLLGSKFKMGGDASAAAGPVGRDAQASTDLTMRAQILTYSRARGLFAGVSLNGGVIRQDGGDTAAFYKQDYSFRSILGGEVPVPKEAQGFVNTVEKYAPTPRVHPAVASTTAPAATTAVPTMATSSSETTGTMNPPPATETEPPADATSTTPPSATPAPNSVPPTANATPAANPTTQAAATPPGAGNQ